MTIPVRILATIVLCTCLAACGETPAPKPVDAKTMSCGEFTKLDQAARVAVVKELTGKPTAEVGPQNAEAVEPMATAMCKSMPDHKVAELILAPPPSPNPPSTR
jgi:hypothetical protein